MGSYRPKSPVALRVVNENNCGTPMNDGTCGYYVRNCMVSMTWEDQLEDPTETLLRCDDDEVQFFDRTFPAYKFAQVTATLNDIDPWLQYMMMGFDQETDAQTLELVGGRLNALTFGKKFFGLEFWNQLATGPSTPACPDGTPQWSYLLFPFNRNARWSTVPTYGNNTDAVAIQFDAMIGGNWQEGPFDVVPDETGAASPLIDPMEPSQVYLQRTTTIAPPTPTDGCVPLPTSPTSPSSP